MKLSKILLVSIILLAILSIGAVSAVDDNSSNLAASNSADIISADTPSQNIYVDTAGNDSNTGSSSSPFASLNRAISQVNASNNATIHVGAGVYSGENNTNLVINLAHLNYNGTLTIIGDSNGGTIIDGDDESPIIYSIGADSIVKLINITFKNGKRDMGSAIRSSGDLTIDSCIFEANEATNLAAIYQEKANPLTIINSKFLKNKASQMADLYFSQNSIITLINNVFDGAITSSSYAYAPGVSIQTGKSIIKGNTFKNLNNSYYAILHVTYNNGDNIANITDNVFINCSYTGSNGALLFTQNAYLKNNSFIDCNSSTAAIYANTNINSKVTFADVDITGTTFNLNATVTDVDGNLVKNAKVYFYINGSNVGSASSGNDGVAKLSVSKLLENGQYTISGTQSYDTNPNPFGVIVSNGTANVDFDHSPAEFWVSLNGNDTTGDGSESNPFLTLKHALDVGTATTVDLTVHVKDGLYTGSQNFALKYSNVGKIKIIGESYGNTIIDVNHTKSGWSSAGVFDLGQNLEATFINLTVINCDGNVVNGYTFTMKDCIVKNSKGIRAQSGNEKVIIDNLTYIDGTGQLNFYNCEIYNSVFKNSNAGTSTGFLWAATNGNKLIILKNNTFENITIAGSSGGAAYYIQGATLAVNNNYINNVVTGSSANYVAYISANNITSINETFIGNDVRSYVAYFRGSNANSEILIENIRFINNTASVDCAGLAINTGKIKGAKFINNTATSNGGALYILNHGKTDNFSPIEIEDVIFENNVATKGNDIFIGPSSGNNVFTHLGDLTITANSLNVTELSDTLTVSVTHPSGAIIGGGEVKFYLDGNLVGKSDLINQNATFTFVGFENNKVYNFTAIYEYANENDTYVSGTVTTNITGQLDSIELYVSDLTGDDNNNGSKDSPFKTISKALAEGYKKSTNVTVHVLEGTYSGTLNTNIDIPTTIYLTIVGEGTNKTIISDNTANYFLTILAGDKHFTLANMTLKRASRDTQSAIYVEEGANAEFNNLEFIECQGNYGGAINTAGILTINNSYFFDNGYYDISKRANAYYGGAIYNDGTLIINNTTFEGNHAGRLSTISTQGELYMYNSNVIDSVDANSMNMDLIAIGAFGGQKGNITIVDSLFKVTNRTINEIIGEHVYNIGNSLTCLAIGSSQNVLIVNTTFVDEGARFSPYVFGGINSWNLASGGYTLVPGDIRVYNSTFRNVQAVNVFYSRTDGMSYHSQRLFEGCLFDNVEYLIATLNTGNFSISIHDSVILSDSVTKIGLASDKTIIMDISDNWWGTNNATYDNATITTTNFISNYVLKLKENTQNIVNPESYLILTLNATDNTGLLQDVTLAFKVFDGENVSDYSGAINPREFVISATNGTLAQTNGTIDGTITIPFEGSENQGYYVEATVDNQTVNFTVENPLFIGNATILAEDILLQHAETQFNVTVLDGDKKVNTGKLVLKLLGETYTADVINGTATFTIPILPRGDYSLEYSFSVDKVYNPTSNSSTLSVDFIVTNETFFNFFDENGTLKDSIICDNLTFVGEFSNLGIDTININKSIDLIGDDVVLNDIGLVIDADDVSVDNFTIVLSEDSGAVAAVSVYGDDVSVQNCNIDVTAPGDHDSYAVLADGADNFILSNNNITYVGNTTGDTFNAAVCLVDCDDADIEDNVMDITLSAVPIVYDPTTWEPTVMSEGVLLDNCSGAVLTGNDINIDYNEAVGNYNNIYGVEFRQSDDAIVSDNEISVVGDEYAYALVMNGDDFIVDHNNISTVANIYANGVEIAGPASGLVDSNNIEAVADSVVYPVYEYSSEVEFTNNNISGSANSVYAMELFGNDEIVENNTIIANGNFTIGVASAAKNLVLNNNNIIAKGTNMGTPTSGDSIKSETVGVKIVRGKVDVKNNDIASNSKFTINATSGSGNITNNNLVGQKLTGDASVSYPSGDYIVKDNTPVKFVTNETFFNFFDENGTLKDSIICDNLTFIGEFSNLGIDTININKSIDLIGDDVVLNDIGLVIDADDVSVDNFTIVLSEDSGAVAAVSVYGDDVSVQNCNIDVTAPGDHDSYAVLADGADNFILSNNNITYVGNTTGDTFNAAVCLVDCDDADIEDNVMDITLSAVPIVYDPTTWEPTVMSEGVLLDNCSGAVLTGNDINIDYNEAVGNYNNIYGVEFRQSDDAIVSDNEISVVGDEYAYALVMNGDDFIVDHNNISTVANIYANGVEIAGPASGLVDSNNIEAVADSVVYPVYEYSSEVEFTNNNISGSANSVYAMELFGNDEIVENNTIIANGNFTIGVASAAKNLVLNNNNIIANGTNRGTPTSGDSIKSETVGVKIVSGEVDVKNNDIASNSEFTINATSGSGNITNNKLVGQKLTGDASVNYLLGNYVVRGNTPAMDKSFVIANDTSLYYHNGTKLEAKLVDGNGKPLANKDIIFEINGVNYTRVSDDKGIARIAINLDAGEYPVNVYYNGSPTQAPSDTSVTVTVLSTVNGTDITKIFRNGTQYYATFRDGQGNYLADGTEVTFNINGVMYHRKVSGNKGLARLNINLDPGNYILTAINPVNGEMASNNITVLAQITENKDLVKYFRNDSQYRVKVLDSKGNAVGANQKVVFNINGVMYERFTDKDGYAQLKINLNPGDYVITADYNGSMVSNNIKVLPIITASDLVKKHGGPEPFKASIVDGQGKPVVGQNVTFNINGVMYNRLSDSNGVAKLNINLNAGEYIITSMYNNASIGNHVTVTN